MAIRFERISLYEEVWSTPLTRLGKKYGLSDNGIRKICKALNIPLPKAGHWAKIAAGHEIPKALLPEKYDKTEYISDPKPTVPVTEEQTEDLIWLAERGEFELNPVNKISVDLKLKKFHSMLMETRRLLAEKLKESQKFKIEAEKEAHPSRRGAPRFNSSRWHYFERQGQVLELYKKGMPFRLTPSTCDRGLAIANALFFAARRRGFEIIKDENNNGLSFKLNDGEVHLRMSEKLKSEVRPLRNSSPLELLLDRGKFKVPTGILRLHLRASGSTSEIEISDTDDNSLQDNLNQVFCKIYKLIIKSRAHGREMAEWHREREIERQRWEEREKIRQERTRLHEIEMRRQADLLKEVKDWQHSELIHQYIAHVDHAAAEAGIEILQNKGHLEWKNWALSAASELDPTPQRIEGLNKS